MEALGYPYLVLCLVILEYLIVFGDHICCFVGSIIATGMLGKLPYRVITPRVQHALLCTIANSCFCDFLG